MTSPCSWNFYEDSDLNDLDQFFNDVEQLSEKPSPPSVESNEHIPLSVIEQNNTFAIQLGESQLPLGDPNVSTYDPEIINEYELFFTSPQDPTAATNALPGLGSVPATSFWGTQLVARKTQADTLTVSSSSSPSQYLNTLSTYQVDHEVPRSPNGKFTTDVNNAVSSSLPTYGEHYDMLPSQSNSPDVIIHPAPVQPQGQAKRGRPPGIKVPGGDRIVDRKERRKEQNRQAATRCRAKRNKEFEDLLKSRDAATEENKQLKAEVEELRRRCDNMYQLLVVHQSHCSLSIPAQLQSRTSR